MGTEYRTVRHREFGSENRVPTGGLKMLEFSWVSSFKSFRQNKVRRNSWKTTILKKAVRSWNVYENKEASKL